MVKLTNGANWKHPEGPGSDISDKWNHPVVNLAYEDAKAMRIGQVNDFQLKLSGNMPRGWSQGCDVSMGK